jgi:hypothetical protein
MHTIKKCLGIFLITLLPVFGIESKAVKTTTLPRTNITEEIEQPKKVETSKSIINVSSI